MLIVINNQDISDGINSAFDVSADIESRFESISSDCGTLFESGHSILDSSHKLEQSCQIESKELDHILNSVTNYLPQIEDVSKDTSHVANNIEDARSKSDPYAHKGRSSLLWVSNYHSLEYKTTLQHVHTNTGYIQHRDKHRVSERDCIFDKYRML